MTGLHEGSIPFRYLGCFLYKGRKKVDYFQHLLLSVHKRISGWMGRFLTPGGRLVLIKHVLSTIPLHVLTVLEPPQAIFNAMEKAFSDFLWKHDNTGARTWRAWEHLVFPYEENGIGFRGFQDLAKANSCKLWWKLHSKEGLWSQYVSSIGVSKSFVSKRLAKVEGLMQENTRMLVGSGGCSFWDVNWSGKGCLMDIFPDIQPIHGSVRQFYGEDGWKVELLPHSVASFVSDVHIQFTDQEDCWVW